MKTVLYRHFDAHGLLLYVGISLDELHRLKQHSFAARWFDQIATIRMERYASRVEALEAEAEAIKTECPLYNIKRPEGSGTPCRAWAVFDQLTGRADGWYMKHLDAHDMLNFYREEIEDNDGLIIVGEGDARTAEVQHALLCRFDLYDITKFACKKQHVQCASRLTTPHEAV